MIFILCVVVLILYLIRRQWKMKGILKLSRLIRSKYTAWPIVGHGLMFLGSAEGQIVAVDPKYPGFLTCYDYGTLEEEYVKPVLLRQSSLSLSDPNIGNSVVKFVQLDVPSRDNRMSKIRKFGREAIKSKHGLISCWLGSQLCIVTSDAAICEVVLKTCLEKTDIVFNIASHLLGNASVFAPVHIWRPRRRVLINAFTVKNLRSYVEIFAEQSAILTRCLKPVADGGTFPIWKYYIAYTMDTLCETTLGIKINAQMQPINPFISALTEYLRIIPLRLVQPNRHWEWIFQLLPVFKKIETAKTTIHDFVNDIVIEKQISLERGCNTSKYNMPVQIGIENSETNERRTFLDELIASSAEGSGFTNKELREETLTLLIAGNDTTAIALAGTTAMLSRHVDLQEKAYQEVCNVFGDSKRHATVEDLPKLVYIEAFIKETLRLYPPSPVIMRENDVNITLASGIVLPVGTYTGIHIWGLHRNPRYWGSDAEEFNPDRFLNGAPTERTAFMPFSFGPRDCLGYKYGMMSMKIAVASLLREYKVLPSSDLASEDLRKPLRMEYTISMKDIDKYKVRLESRT